MTIQTIAPRTPSVVRCPSVKAVLALCTPAGPWLAGGAARKLMHCQLLGNSDLDLFCRNKQQVKDLQDWLTDNSFALLRTTKTGTETYSNDSIMVQVITNQVYEDLYDLFASFDFTICQFGFDGEKYHYTANALDAHRRHLLVVNKITLPLYSLARVAKYADQGLDGSLQVLIKLARAAQQELADRGEGGSHGA